MPACSDAETTIEEWNCESQGHDLSGDQVNPENRAVQKPRDSHGISIVSSTQSPFQGSTPLLRAENNKRMVAG